MNKQQNAALWATALRDLADAISRGLIEPPTSMDMWHHDIEVRRLMQIADEADPRTPLRVRYQGNFNAETVTAAVTVSTGTPPELPISSHYFAKVSDQSDRDAIAAHNDQCVSAPVGA